MRLSALASGVVGRDQKPSSQGASLIFRLGFYFLCRFDKERIESVAQR
jgi:hypothetical protein